jgi:hypothetical protein
MMRVHVEMVHPLLGMQPCGLIPNLNYYPPQSEALRGHKATCQSSDSVKQKAICKLKNLETRVREDQIDLEVTMTNWTLHTI